MLKNFWKTAIRNLIRYKGYSLINITSLSVAMAICILIFIYVKDEYSYDSFHTLGGRIHYVTAGSDSMVLNISENLGPALAREYPEIKTSIRFGSMDGEVKAENEIFRETIYSADPDFFKVFSFPMKQGSAFPTDMPDTLVISEKAAEKYFGVESPIDQTIALNFGDKFIDFIITGVARKIPENSSIQFDFLIPTRDDMFQDEQEGTSAWQDFEFGTFVLLAGGANISQFHDKSVPFLEKNFKAIFQKANLDPKNFKLYFLPFRDFHLKSDSTSGGMVATGNRLHSWLMSGIGFLVLLISCFNFINLTIARSSSRFKEIGIRKVVGASRFSLVKQFWMEAITVSSAALLVSLLLAEILRPMFNSLAGKNLTLEHHFYSSSTFLFLAAMTLFIGIFAGTYPALIGSRISLVNIIKGRERLKGKSFFSRAVVVFQFALSLFLIIEAVVIFKQKNYLMNKDLGFDQKNLLAIPTKAQSNNHGEGESLFMLFKNELSGRKDIFSISGSSGILGKNRSAIILKKDKTPVITIMTRIDYDYLDTLNIRIAEGRNFQHENISDVTNSVIVNQTFIKTFEIEDPLNQPIKELEWGGLKNPVIVGIAGDYNYLSLRDQIYPMIMHLDKKSDIQYIVARINPSGTSEILDQMKQIWNRFKPDQTFEYLFFDDEIRLSYREEERWNQIMGYSSLFAILIAAMGLFGLTGISISRRFKEIGIRKVMGASSLEIIKMINKEFLVLVASANILVWPVAYLVSSKWLQNFPYRTQLTPVEFITGGLIVLIVAAVTISSLAVKASILNPADILRDE